MKRRNPFVRELMALLRDEVGATDVRYDPCHRHPRIRFALHGAERWHLLPSSPGDMRAINHHRAQIRRLARRAG